MGTRTDGSVAVLLTRFRFGSQSNPIYGARVLTGSQPNESWPPLPSPQYNLSSDPWWVEFQACAYGDKPGDQTDSVGYWDCSAPGGIRI